MSVLDRLRREASPVARRRRVSAARSWVTYSPKRAKTVGLVAGSILALGIFGGVAQASVWVQSSIYDAQVKQYEASLANPTGEPTLQLYPVIPDTPVPDVPAAGSTTPPPVVTVTPAPPPAADKTADVLARKWVQVWLGGPSAPSQEVWAERFRPMLRPSLFPAYAAANRSLIPKAGIKSVETITQGGKAYATVTLTNGVVTLVVMEGGPGSWVVVEFTDVPVD